MSIELKKEVFRLSEVPCCTGAQVFCEADIIVPDIKPDIATILDVAATPVITSRSIANESVSLEGYVDNNIIYLGDDGCVRAINSSSVGSGVSATGNIVTGTHAIRKGKNRTRAGRRI